ncbi:SagB/ThcOx family dehydrogenase [Kribbella sp. DT2]|uniref:SagB/ThcOx family dehydrogenase n=1 Tax=Kribbella sp. DT2 TaxID=3393427 RepID=UPI003CF26110
MNATRPPGSAIALEYAERMFRRQQVVLPPMGFRVDWDDQPARHKLYVDVPKVPLPAPFDGLPAISVAAAASVAAGPVATEMPSAEQLASVLGCYGLIGRRTQPNWNEDSSSKLGSDRPVWARPTASGGGMYPAESYLVAGPAAPLRAGVYHYDTAAHSLDRLSGADHSADLAEATGTAAGLYLVSTLRFWKNAFKYNSFSYHVVTQDVGALLASWRLVLGAFGAVPQPVLWFDEGPVCAALGVDGRTEAPFVVVPLGPTGAAGEPTGERLASRPVPRERHRVWERSRRVRDFPMVEQVHAAALVGDSPRPVAGPEVAVGSGPETSIELQLPEATTPESDLATSLRTRRSSFGLFSARPALAAADLGQVLATVAAVSRGGTDTAPAPRTGSWIRQWVLPNSVEGLEKRGYLYDDSRHRLVGVQPIDFSELQRHYALANYNLQEVAAVLVLTGRLEALVETYGARGYRMLSIEVGQAAQSTYLAATAQGIGVGAVLGIDNPAVDDMLGLTGTGESSMLFILLGHERRVVAGYEHLVHGPEGVGR